MYTIYILFRTFLSPLSLIQAIFSVVSHNWASLVTQIVKSLPEMQETQVKSLSQEHPLAKGMALHSSILAWRIPWTEEPDGL